MLYGDLSTEIRKSNHEFDIFKKNYENQFAREEYFDL